MNESADAVEIRRLLEDEDVAASFSVMQELRPHLTGEGEFRTTVRRLEREIGYRLVGAFVGEALQAVAGYRIAESLAWGRHLYVVDLVTRSPCRSRGLGARLYDWLCREGRREGCRGIHLDSGVQRHAAHRFYLRQRMDISCFHFQQSIGPP